MVTERSGNPLITERSTYKKELKTTVSQILETKDFYESQIFQLKAEIDEWSNAHQQQSFLIQELQNQNKSLVSQVTALMKKNITDREDHIKKV